MIAAFDFPNPFPPPSHHFCASYLFNFDFRIACGYAGTSFRDPVVQKPIQHDSQLGTKTHQKHDVNQAPHRSAYEAAEVFSTHTRRH